ncbi:MAG: hypothetical protein RQ754_06775 [Desulfuromonadales bacterium]|nr:hypothetical protein [Desulfuromonadales bacterium]
MKIPVILNNCEELRASKDELQSLLSANQVICFRRSDGWAFVGYDRMRGLGTPYVGTDRRIDESLLAS